MFYIQARAKHTAQRWHEVAGVERLPVYSPQPHRGLWHINAAALTPWSLKSIAAYLARLNKTTRQSWVQATEQHLSQIAEGFTVKADEWELIETPEFEDSGVFFVPPGRLDRFSYGQHRHFYLAAPAPTDRNIYAAAAWRGAGNKLLATHYPLFAYSNHHPTGEGATSSN